MVNSRSSVGGSSSLQLIGSGLIGPNTQTNLSLQASINIIVAYLIPILYGIICIVAKNEQRLTQK